MPQIKINDTMDWLMTKMLSCRNTDSDPRQKYFLTRLRENLTNKLNELVRLNFTHYK